MARSVLLIEDESNIVEAIRFILSRDGWQVATHSNGATALATILQLRPNAIVLDAMLPNKSGFDILRDFTARTIGQRHPRFDVDRDAASKKIGTWPWPLVRIII